MPDLSLASCHKFWQDYPDPHVYKAIVLLESAEDWTLDGEESVEQALDELSHAFDKNASFTLQDKDRVIALCSCLGMSRKLRIMQVIDQGDPGAASKLLSHAEANQTASSSTRLFLRRNIIFERIRLVSRILSSNRLDVIKKALSHEE